MPTFVKDFSTARKTAYDDNDLKNDKNEEEALCLPHDGGTAC